MIRNKVKKYQQAISFSFVLFLFSGITLTAEAHSTNNNLLREALQECPDTDTWKQESTCLKRYIRAVLKRGGGGKEDRRPYAKDFLELSNNALWNALKGGRVGKCLVTTTSTKGEFQLGTRHGARQTTSLSRKQALRHLKSWLADIGSGVNSNLCDLQ